MPVEVTAMKKRPSKRASRLRRARSSAPRSRPRISSIRSRYPRRTPPTSRFRTQPPEVPQAAIIAQLQEAPRMARLRLLLFVAFLLGALDVTQAAAPSSAETELRKIVQDMLDAVAPGNADVWRRYLHERVLRVDENGAVQTKEDLLKE